MARPICAALLLALLLSPAGCRFTGPRALTLSGTIEARDVQVGSLVGGRVAAVRVEEKELVVTAPAAGIVQSIDLRPGDLVAAGAPVATLLEPAQTWVRLYVPETRLGLIRLGQAVALTVDTYPGRTFTGRVVEINPRGEYTPRNIQTMEQRNDLVFGIRVVIDPRPELLPGMSVVATIGAPPAARERSAVDAR